MLPPLNHAQTWNVRYRGMNMEKCKRFVWAELISKLLNSPLFRSWTKGMKDFWQELSLHFRVRQWRVQTPCKRLAMLGLFWSETLEKNMRSSQPPIKLSIFFYHWCPNCCLYIKLITIIVIRLETIMIIIHYPMQGKFKYPFCANYPSLPFCSAAGVQQFIDFFLFVCLFSHYFVN